MSQKLDFPVKPETTPINAEIDTELVLEAKAQAKRLKLKFREAIEFGLRAFIEAAKGRKP